MLFGKKKNEKNLNAIESANKSADENWIKVFGPNILTEFNQNFELYTYLDGDDQAKEDAHSRCLKLLKEEPGFLFAIDDENHNIMERMVLINGISRFIDLLRESGENGGVGVIALTDSRFLREPLCFSVLQSSQNADIVRVNKEIEQLGVNPVNSENEKWTKIYKAKESKMEEDTLVGQKIFSERIKPIVKSLINVHTEDTTQNR